MGLPMSKRKITSNNRSDRTEWTTELSLRERIKELNCLYEVGRAVEKYGERLEELFKAVVKILPPSWLYPEVACARISFEGKRQKSANFKESPWVIAADILAQGRRVGVVEVHYLENKPVLDEGPFLKEERSLIDAVAADAIVAYRLL